MQPHSKKGVSTLWYMYQQNAAKSMSWLVTLDDYKHTREVGTRTAFHVKAQRKSNIFT